LHFDAVMRRHQKPWTLGEVLAGGIGGFVHWFVPAGPCYGCVASHLQRSVAVDNTNARAEDRAPLIALGRAAGARVVAYVLDTTPKESAARNRTRTGRERVPNVAVFVTAKRLQPPTAAEGFDAVYRVHAEGGAFEVVVER